MTKQEFVRQNAAIIYTKAIYDFGEYDDAIEAAGDLYEKLRVREYFGPIPKVFQNEWPVMGDNADE